MSLYEPRCLVCGTPLSRGAPFEGDVRKSEVCSEKCYEIYMTDPREDPRFQAGDESRFGKSQAAGSIKIKEGIIIEQGRS